jgi:hypothetical protein
MITFTNYGSGELLITDDAGTELRLTRDQATRLIMTARMHTVDEFIEKLPSLLTDQNLVKKILAEFEGKTSTQRWNLKEKFARLGTLTRNYEPSNPAEAVESVRFEC